MTYLLIDSKGESLIIFASKILLIVIDVDGFCWNGKSTSLRFVPHESK